MTKSEAASFRNEFDVELFSNIVPFWERHSPDREYGGYFTCLDRDGTVFDTDKFLWMQGRELWCFSHLYRTVDQKGSWLELARLGAEFLRNYGKAENGDYYFSLDRRGAPLVQPYNIFSDCFCAAGLAEYGRVSGEKWAMVESVATWYRIQERKTNPKGIWTKQIAKNRPVRTMAMSMMQLWMAKVFSGLIPQAELDQVISDSIRNVLSFHVDRNKKAVFERVLDDGSRPQGMDGRLLSPGHALETLWFILDTVRDIVEPDATNTNDLLEGFGMEGVAEAMLWTIERGWDQKYGGIYYYQDFEGYPTEKLESGMKLWWVHAEALCAFLLAYRITGNPDYSEWFEKIRAWTWEHFRDPLHGEWYGYLDNRGNPASTLKGGKWKGMFHIPRALLFCRNILAEICE